MRKKQRARKKGDELLDERPTATAIRQTPGREKRRRLIDLVAALMKLVPKGRQSFSYYNMQLATPQEVVGTYHTKQRVQPPVRDCRKKKTTPTADVRVSNHKETKRLKTQQISVTRQHELAICFMYCTNMLKNSRQEQISVAFCITGGEKEERGLRQSTKFDSPRNL